MLRKLAVSFFAVAAVAAAAAAPSLLQEPEMPKPMEQHKHLLESVGTWEGTVQMFEEGMDSTPVPATETIEAIGEFWTQAKFQSAFMGMPYTGTGCLGYDPVKKAYVGNWIDSMSPMFTFMEGQMDPATRKLVMRWKGPDMTGAIVDHRIETTHTKDAYTSTFFAGAGEGKKTMVIEMKRKGAAAGNTAK